MKRSPPWRQRGATLLVALIMLVVMTLAAVLSYNIGKSNTVIVGNQQAQQQAEDSARAALEEVVSRSLFAETPTVPFGSTNQKSYDVNGDGAADVAVVMTPRPCIRNFVILPVDPEDTGSLGCVSQAQQNLGVEGAASWGSSCADVTWEITAAATDTVTQASTTAVQGIRIRQDANATIDSSNYCQ